jgi:hypothetical protein
MRRIGGGNEDNPRRTEPVRRRSRDFDMRVMNGVESASEKNVAGDDISSVRSSRS